MIQNDCALKQEGSIVERYVQSTLVIDLYVVLDSKGQLHLLI